MPARKESVAVVKGGRVKKSVFFGGRLAADDNNDEWDGVVRKTEGGRAECKAELSFLASLVRDAGAAERHRWEELSRCVTENTQNSGSRTKTHKLDVYSSYLEAAPWPSAIGVLCATLQITLQRPGQRRKDVSCQWSTCLWSCNIFYYYYYYRFSFCTITTVIIALWCVLFI